MERLKWDGSQVMWRTTAGLITTIWPVKNHILIIRRPTISNTKKISTQHISTSIKNFQRNLNCRQASDSKTRIIQDCNGEIQPSTIHHSANRTTDCFQQ